MLIFINDFFCYSITLKQVDVNGIGQYLDARFLFFSCGLVQCSQAANCILLVILEQYLSY